MNHQISRSDMVITNTNINANKNKNHHKKLFSDKSGKKSNENKIYFIFTRPYKYKMNRGKMNG